MTQKHESAFVEFDRDTEKFDNIQLYNQLFESEDFCGAEGTRWPDARFPEILVVTTNRTRARCIEGLIDLGNKNEIRIKVKLLDEIKHNS